MKKKTGILLGVSALLLGIILGYNSEIKNVDTLCTLLQSRGYKGQTIRMSDYSMLNNTPIVVQ